MKASVQIMRYALIGIGNTGIHLFIAGVLNVHMGLSQMYANLIAYVIASTLSFLMNAKWSFQKKPEIRNYSRFQLVSLFGLILSAGFGYLGDHFGWHFALTVLLIALTSPALSFLLHRSYTFQNDANS
jgi:putative flippase GtrA